MPQPSLLGLSGSIRRGSTNTAILRTIAGHLGSKASMTLFPLNDVPLYNGDLEGEHLPPPVQALKDAIAGADGIILCSPEYNHGMSGVLKNALDWASRPGFNSPLKNKPALIMSSSPGAIGGARAHAQVRETLASALARVVARPQVTIAGIFQKVTDGHLTDEASLKFCLEAVDDLLSEIRLLSAQPA
ncbi:MAG TPA: NADPH-dependent FMN reductase [Stellaceae bacterium]|nr:NADPH-dependent FMN reductase [Stellaceae bacterium]